MTNMMLLLRNLAQTALFRELFISKKKLNRRHCSKMTTSPQELWLTERERDREGGRGRG